MSIAGNLNTMQVAELLQWLSHSSKTGTLIINNGETEKRIFFQGGKIFSSSSTDPKEHLGHFLVSHGFITEPELSQAMALQESNKMLLGKILVTIGAISEQDLQRLLRHKVEESIYDVFSWDEAEFRFLDGDLPSSTLVPLNLDATAIIMEGARRADEWGRIRQYIPSMDAIPVSTGELEPPPEDPGAAQILSLVNDDSTIEEICLQTHSSEYRVSKVLFDQIRLGRLKVIRPRWKESREQEEPAQGVTAQALVAAAEKLLLRQDYQGALRHLRAARSLEPDNREIKRATEDAGSKIHQALEEAGVRLEAVPKLNVKLEDLTSLPLSPQEGFILTRIDDRYDIKSILKISPMQQLEGMAVFWRLHNAGHIRLE